MYLIWKANINDYRVLNTKTNVVEVLTHFTMLNCSFRVDINAYNKAKASNFANSGKENDYFAWIECSKVIKHKPKMVKSTVFYNPFKSAYFKLRDSFERTDFAKKIVVNANTLGYGN